MAPWGGREKVIGTNPWSIAAPYGDTAIAVDIANTPVARGKIYLARQRRPRSRETVVFEASAYGLQVQSHALAL